jgi:antitoxin HigA-1
LQAFDAPKPKSFLPINHRNGLARDLSVPVRRVNDIVQGKRPITPDTALRLAVYFNMTPEFWMNLQSHYDLKVAKRNLLPKIARSIRPAEEKAA